jgi:hypothetical protein
LNFKKFSGLHPRPPKWGCRGREGEKARGWRGEWKVEGGKEMKRRGEEWERGIGEVLTLLSTHV